MVLAFVNWKPYISTKRIYFSVAAELDGKILFITMNEITKVPEYYAMFMCMHYTQIKLFLREHTFLSYRMYGTSTGYVGRRYLT